MGTQCRQAPVLMLQAFNGSIRFFERVQKMNIRALAVALLLASCRPISAEVQTTSTSTPPVPASTNAPAALTGEVITLPTPQRKGTLTLEETLARRRSVREFSETPLSSSELGQLLWAAQGVTDPAGLRTAPSAGALYPLELYAVTREGVYHYEPAGHRLMVQARGDVRRALYTAALQQNAVLNAPAVMVIAAVYARTAQRYGEERAPRYVHLETGHAAQNMLLQAVALDLVAVPTGAFEDDKVKQALALPPDQEPLYLIPVGHPR